MKHYEYKEQYKYKSEAGSGDDDDDDDGFDILLWRSETKIRGDVPLGLKHFFCSVPVSDRPCQFMCDPNYFMILGKNKNKNKK